MNRLIIHPEIRADLKICYRKKWYSSLGKELPGICKLLVRDGMLPGERPVRHLGTVALQNKAFRAGINLPNENVSKREGGRIVYVKESAELLKILYVGGHKDKRYDDSHVLVKLICERYQTANDLYKIYSDGLNLSV